MGHFLQFRETKSFLSKNCLYSFSIPETDFLNHCSITQFKADVFPALYFFYFLITDPSVMETQLSNL